MFVLGMLADLGIGLGLAVIITLLVTIPAVIRFQCPNLYKNGGFRYLYEGMVWMLLSGAKDHKVFRDRVRSMEASLTPPSIEG